ncbi:hypothetical protein [Brevundimonas sp.]|uniref:hypothetical protein n=1 Tax=Brevundimonas sp. TaxID=1871086 RepID=UPI002D24E32C|nr:hypothetical protein [Brevundimonas sp.]HYC73445.1 hypothetical protein [Brevundimonas sp.]
MEQMTITPSRRLQAHHAYGRSADVFEPVAWRPPSPARFDTRVANDLAPEPEPTLSEMVDGIPGWVTVVLGGVVAALAGAFLGGALQI